MDRILFDEISQEVYELSLEREFLFREVSRMNERSDKIWKRIEFLTNDPEFLEFSRGDTK